MDEFTRQGLSDRQMQDANKCRIYLRAFYVSDITDLGGKSIEEWAKHGKRQATRTIKWNWPVQQIEKLENGTPMHRIRRWIFIPTFGTIGRHQKLASEHRMESGCRCNDIVQTQGRHVVKT
jgi:hypothetical protein